MTSCRQRSEQTPSGPLLDTGLMLSAARSFRISTRRVGTRKGWLIPKPCRRDACATSGVTFYDTLPLGAGL